MIRFMLWIDWRNVLKSEDKFIHQDRNESLLAHWRDVVLPPSCSDSCWGKLQRLASPDVGAYWLFWTSFASDQHNFLNRIYINTTKSNVTGEEHWNKTNWKMSRSAFWSRVDRTMRSTKIMISGFSSSPFRLLSNNKEDQVAPGVEELYLKWWSIQISPSIWPDFPWNCGISIWIIVFSFFMLNKFTWSFKSPISSRRRSQQSLHSKPQFFPLKILTLNSKP